jgi:hypothetical protein
MSDDDDKLTPRKVFDALRSNALELRSTTWLQRELATQESVTNPDRRKIAKLKAELEKRRQQP